MSKKSKKNRLQMQKKKRVNQERQVGNFYVSDDFPDELISPGQAVLQAYIDGLNGELESISDELIDELVGNGWDKEQLIGFRAMGWLYSRRRNSLVGS